MPTEVDHAQDQSNIKIARDQLEEAQRDALTDPEIQVVRGMVAEALSPEAFWHLQDDLRTAFAAHARRFGEWSVRQNRAWQLLDNWMPNRWPRPQAGPKAENVALVGMAYEWRLAPWGRLGWELWGLNDAYQRVGHPPVRAYTRWFQVHNPAYMAKHYKKGLEVMCDEWGARTGVRLYMDRAYDEYPDSEPLPLAELAQLTARGDYHCSSFDWMVAMAILEGFKKIQLVGVDFYTPPPFNGEPLSARPCLEYWIGVAEGRGIEVEMVGDGGHLFQNLHLALRRSRLRYGLDREPALDLSKEDRAWTDVR